MPRIDLRQRKSPRQARSTDTVETILAAAAHEATGNANQAEKTIERLISQNPSSDQAYVRVAEFQAKAGRAADAEKTLRRGLGVNERSPSLQIASSSVLRTPEVPEL